MNKIRSRPRPKLPTQHNTKFTHTDLFIFQFKRSTSFQNHRSIKNSVSFHRKNANKHSRASRHGLHIAEKLHAANSPQRRSRHHQASQKMQRRRIQQVLRYIYGASKDPQALRTLYFKLEVVAWGVLHMEVLLYGLQHNTLVPC